MGAIQECICPKKKTIKKIYIQKNNQTYPSSQDISIIVPTKGESDRKSLKDDNAE